MVQWRTLSQSKTSQTLKLGGKKGISLEVRGMTPDAQRLFWNNDSFLKTELLGFYELNSVLKTFT